MLVRVHVFAPAEHPPSKPLVTRLAMSARNASSDAVSTSARLEGPRRARLDRQAVLDPGDFREVRRIGRVHEYPSREDDIRRIEPVDRELVLPGSWKTSLMK